MVVKIPILRRDGVMIRFLLMVTFAAVLCLGLFSVNTQASDLSASFTEKLAKQSDAKPYDSLAKALQSTFKKSDSTSSVKASKSNSGSKLSKTSSASKKSKISSAKKPQKSYAKKSRTTSSQSKNMIKKAKSQTKKAKNIKTSQYKR